MARKKNPRANRGATQKDAAANPGQSAAAAQPAGIAQGRAHAATGAAGNPVAAASAQAMSTHVPPSASSIPASPHTKSAPALPRPPANDELRVADKTGFEAAIYLANDSQILRPDGSKIDSSDVGWTYEMGDSDSRSEGLDMTYMIPMAPPDGILVVKDAPGRRVYDLNQGDISEGIGLRIAAYVADGHDLSELRQFMEDGLFTHQAILEAVPGARTRFIKGVNEVMTAAGWQAAIDATLPNNANSAVKACAEVYSMVTTHALKQMIHVVDTRKFAVIHEEPEFIVNDDVLLRETIIAQCMEIFAPAHFKRFTESLPKELNPTTLAAHLAAFLREQVEPLQSLADKIVMLRTAFRLARSYAFDPTGLPDELLAFPPLRRLSRLINVYAGLLGNTKGQHFYTSTSISERKRSIEFALSVLRNSPRMALVSTKTFIELFGVTSCHHLGTFRGAVLWRHHMLDLKFDMMWRTKEATPYLTPCNQNQYPYQQVGKQYTDAFMDVGTWQAVASLIARELAVGGQASSSHPVVAQLRGLMIPENELLCFALARADALYADVDSRTGEPFARYGVNAHDQWVGKLPRSNGTQYIFDDEKAAVLYWAAGHTVKSEILPRSHDLRPGQIRDVALRDRSLIGLSSAMLDDSVVQAYSATVDFPSPQYDLDGGVHNSIDIVFTLLQGLSGFLGPKGSTPLAFSSAAQPSWFHFVDHQARYRASILLWVVACLASAPNRAIRDHTTAWLHVRFGAIASSVMADAAAHTGEQMAREKLHAGHYRGDLPQIFAEAAMHRAIAPLMRFGYLSFPTLKALIRAMPVQYIIPEAIKVVGMLYQESRNIENPTSYKG